MRALVRWLHPDSIRRMEVDRRRRLRAPLSVLRDYATYARRKSSGYKGDDLRSLCVVLGPYRNLSTLTASIAMLHPACQVLNHAAVRILPIVPANFFIDYSNEKFDRFVDYALAVSAGGRRGADGGSVLHAHAFDDERLRAAYRARFGDAMIKPQVKSLVWKDSMRLQNYLRREQIDLAALFRQNRQLRFLLPIRNPIDCAISSLKRGHARFLVDRREPGLEEVLEQIVLAIAWFMAQRDEWPDRFHYFTERQISSRLLVELADFLEVEQDLRWQQEALSFYTVRPSYDHDARLVERYGALVDRHLGRWPALAAQLRALCAPAVVEAAG